MQRTKFESKAYPCVFFGYDEMASAAILGKLPGFGIIYSAHGQYNDEDFPCRAMDYRGWDSTHTYDVVEDEPLAKWLGPGDHQPTSPYPWITPAMPVTPQSQEGPSTQSAAPPLVRHQQGGQHRASIPGASGTPDQQPTSVPGLRRSTRGWHPSATALERIAANDPTAEIAAQVDDLLKDGEESVFQTMDNEFFQADLAHSTQDIEIPRTFAQVLRLPQEEKMKWIRACQRESASHLAIPSISGVLRQDEWTKAPPVRLTWVFAKKDIYKARIVLLGQHMQEGIHFNDTHSPVPSVTCVRLVLALTAASQRKLTQMDVKTAFLNAPIDIELDVILPDGFGPGENNEQFSSFANDVGL